MEVALENNVIEELSWENRSKYYVIDNFIFKYLF